MGPRSWRLIPLQRHPLPNYVGVDTMADCDAGDGCAWSRAFLNNLGFEQFGSALPIDRSLTARVLRTFVGAETNALAQGLRAPVARFGRREVQPGRVLLPLSLASVSGSLLCIRNLLKEFAFGEMASEVV